MLEFNYKTHKPAVAMKFSLNTAPPHRWVLENPKNEVRRTETCHGYRPNGAFFPPTILVSGRARAVDTPHSKFLAADNVSLPGAGLIGANASVGILLSRISVVEKIVVCGGFVGVVLVGWREEVVEG